MIYCIDIDGTICTKTEDSTYKNAKPRQLVIDKINRLYDEGNHIKIFTARGGTTGKDWTKLTTEQLRKWGVKYHSLITGKPAADFYIDDKGLNPGEFVLGRDYDLEMERKERKEHAKNCSDRGCCCKNRWDGT